MSCAVFSRSLPSFFFFNDTATTELYTLSLHDALPIFHRRQAVQLLDPVARLVADRCRQVADRKSTRLNSSHANSSYAVFCLKTKNMWSHRPKRKLQLTIQAYGQPIRTIK